MKSPPGVELLHIFPLEYRGDTLIITPRGDAAGFGGAEFYREQAAVQEIVKSPDVKNLIVDLGEATYYGSTVIGAINRFGIEVRNKGGRIALCRVSDDTRYILRTMRLDELWEHYPTRSQALAVMVSEPWSARFRRPVLWGLMAAGLLAVIVVYGDFSGRKADGGNYRRIMALYRDMQEMADRGASPGEWDAFNTRARREMQPIIEDLEDSASNRERAKQYLLFAVRDYLLPLAERHMAVEDGELARKDEGFCTYMVLARCAIDGRDPPARYRKPSEQPTPPERAATPDATDAAARAADDPESPHGESGPTQGPVAVDAEGNPIGSTGP